MTWAVSACIAALAVSPAAADACHRYGAIVELSGAFAPAVLADGAAGADDPGRIPSRTSDLLVLDAPLCVLDNPVSRGVEAALDVQLLCPSLVADGGDAITLTGRLVGAHTGNGHTPVLLSCMP